MLAYTALCGPNIMVQIHSWHKHFVYTVLEVTNDQIQDKNMDPKRTKILNSTKIQDCGSITPGSAAA